MGKTLFIKAEEVAKEMEISKALAYRLIRTWNEELAAKGFTTVPGRVSRKYFRERIYGLSQEGGDEDAGV